MREDARSRSAPTATTRRPRPRRRERAGSVSIPRIRAWRAGPHKKDGRGDARNSKSGDMRTTWKAKRCSIHNISAGQRRQQNGGSSPGNGRRSARDGTGQAEGGPGRGMAAWGHAAPNNTKQARMPSVARVGATRRARTDLTHPDPWTAAGEAEGAGAAQQPGGPGPPDSAARRRDEVGHVDGVAGSFTRRGARSTALDHGHVEVDWRSPHLQTRPLRSGFARARDDESAARPRTQDGRDPPS